MKIYLAAILALGLSGCSDIDLFGDSSGPPEPAPVADQSAAPAPQAAEESPGPGPVMAAPEDSDSPAPASPQPVAAETEPPVVSAARSAPARNAAVVAHCKTLARQRAGDAAFQGEDPETQDAVYSRTYSDCVAWDAAHRS